MTSLVLLAVMVGQLDPAPDAGVPVAAEKVAEVAPKSPEPAKLSWLDKVTLNGFARVGFYLTVPFRDEQLVGGHSGFRLADFRLGAEFKPVDRLTITASVELAAPLVDPNDPLVGRRIVEARDLIVEYEVAKAAVIRAGQFRPPFDAEMLLGDGALPFTGRSIVASGLAPPDGYGPRVPLAPERQLGVQIGSRRLGGKSVGFRYAAAVFNGAGPNQLYNDNNSPMPVARVELELFEHLTLGANASYNVVSSGVRPNRLYTNQLGYGVDVVGQVGGFSALVAFLGRSSQFSFAGLQPESSLGLTAQARYFHEASGLEGAVRFAWYEPSSAQTDDQATEFTVMIGWKPFRLPFRVLAQYTHRGEEALAAIDNDSIDFMLHAVW